MKIPSREGKEGFSLQGWVLPVWNNPPLHPSSGGESFSSFVVSIFMLAVQSALPSAPESVFDRRGASPLQVYALRPVTNCYCVAVRRGGELQEVNDPSVG